MPVVLGDYQFEGVDDGIYAQFDAEEYGKDLSYTLLSQEVVVCSLGA